MFFKIYFQVSDFVSFLKKYFHFSDFFKFFKIYLQFFWFWVWLSSSSIDRVWLLNPCVIWCFFLFRSVIWVFFLFPHPYLLSPSVLCALGQDKFQPEAILQSDMKFEHNTLKQVWLLHLRSVLSVLVLVEKLILKGIFYFQIWLHESFILIHFQIFECFSSRWVSFSQM